MRPWSRRRRCREPRGVRGRRPAPARPAWSARRPRQGRWPAPPRAADRCRWCRGTTRRWGHRWRAAPRGGPTRRRRRPGRAPSDGRSFASAAGRPCGGPRRSGRSRRAPGWPSPRWPRRPRRRPGRWPRTSGEGRPRPMPAGPRAPSAVSSAAGQQRGQQDGRHDQDDRLRGGQPAGAVRSWRRARAGRPSLPRRRSTTIAATMIRA